MDFKAILIKSPSRDKISQVIDYVDNNAFLFKQLIDIYLAGPYRITQITEHALEGLIRRHPSLIKPHLSNLINAIQKPSATDSLKRNTVKLLQFITIPSWQKGKVIDVCFRFISDKKQPIAVKVFSMTVIAQNTTGEPELRNELKIIIEDQLPYAGPAFRSRAKRVLAKL